MKIKLKELKPNPYKKDINKGKLNKEQVDKIRSNLKKLGFFGSIPIFKKDGQYYIIAGHHRCEALKQEFGKDYEVNVDVHNYSDEQILRAMVIENLTQRSGEFRETNANIVAVEKYLNDNEDVLKRCRESRHLSKAQANTKQMKKVTALDIAEWLDSETGRILTKDEILYNLRIFHNLDKELQDKIQKKHDQTKTVRESDESISYSQAVILSGIDDKEEQKDIAKALHESKENRVREQAVLVKEYKEAPDDIKDKVREGHLDISEVDVAVFDKQVKAKQTGEKTEFIPNFKGRIEDFGYNVAKLETQVAMFRKVFRKDTFNTKYKSLGVKERGFVNASIHQIRNRIKKCYDDVEVFVDMIENPPIEKTKRLVQKTNRGK